MRTKSDNSDKSKKSDHLIYGIGIATFVIGIIILILLLVKRGSSDKTLNLSDQDMDGVNPHISVETLDLSNMTEDFVECDVTATSSVKDIKVFFTEANGDAKRIAGIPFKVKLINPSDSAQLIALVLDINAVDEEMDKVVDSNKQLSVLRTKKADILKSYTKLLDSIEGKELVDDDKDGEIYEKDMTPGDYTLCFYPVNNYITSDFTKLATVRNKVEYKVVNNIKKTFKVYTESEDIPLKQVQSLKDTVTYVESSDGIKGELSSPKVDRKTVSATAPDSRRVSLTLARAESSSNTDNNSSGNNNGSDTNNSQTGSSTTSSIIHEGTLYQATSQGNDTKQFDVTVALNRGTLTETSAAYEAAITYSSGTCTAEITSVSIDGSVSEASSFTLNTGDHTVGVSFKVTLNDDGNKYTGTGYESFNISVDSADRSGVLKDADGNQLYKDEACTKLATEADYNASPDGKFYKQTKVYYGWQNISGARYFFDSTGKKVTGSQVIQGVMYTFGTDGILVETGTGIDVSKYQGDINWSKVKGQISFAIIRCGFRATKTAAIIEDPRYREYMKGAKANGIPTGIYFYSTALNEAEAVEEASAAVALADEMGGCSLPIYIDMEDSTRGQHKLTNAERTAICEAFCSVVKSAGYTPGVYASQSWLTYSINTNKFANDIQIWVAEYKSACTYKGRYNIWQYGTGSVDGISGKVDMNIRY